MLALSIGLTLVVLILSGVILLLVQELKWSRKMVEGLRQEAVAAIRGWRASDEKLIHHLTTMRKEGFTFQPEDESFEPIRLTNEYEADLEEASRGGE